MAYLKLAAGGLGLLAFLAALGWAGELDYTEQIILHMSQKEYDSVRKTLAGMFGHEPSERDIAHWWAEHHKD